MLKDRIEWAEMVPPSDGFEVLDEGRHYRLARSGNYEKFMKREGARLFHGRRRVDA